MPRTRRGRGVALPFAQSPRLLTILRASGTRLLPWRCACRVGVAGEKHRETERPRDRETERQRDRDKDGRKEGRKEEEEKKKVSSHNGRCHTGTHMLLWGVVLLMTPAFSLCGEHAFPTRRSLPTFSTAPRARCRPNNATSQTAAVGRRSRRPASTGRRVARVAPCLS